MDSDEFTLFDMTQLVAIVKVTLWNHCKFSHKMSFFYTYKARGVVIPHSLGITIGLQQGIGCNDLILQRSLECLSYHPIKNNVQNYFRLTYTGKCFIFQNRVFVKGDIGNI